jgi:hypothetical protein
VQVIRQDHDCIDRKMAAPAGSRETQREVLRCDRREPSTADQQASR